MSYKKGTKFWDSLKPPAFRAYVNKIMSVEAVSALFTDFDASVKTVTDDLAYPEETDAERHPRTSAWRKKAEKALVIIKKRRAIAMSRMLVLGGAAPETLNEIVEQTIEKKRARRKLGLKGAFEELRAIVSALATYDVLTENEDGSAECLLCEHAITIGEPLSDHAETCPWRWSVEEVEEFPNYIGFLPELNEQIKTLENKLDSVQRSAKLLALEKKYKKQLLHGQRMSDERSDMQLLLTLAVQALTPYHDNEKVRETLQFIGKIDPHQLQPRDKRMELDMVDAIIESRKHRLEQLYKENETVEVKP